MATVSGSFTGVEVSPTLIVREPGEDVTVSISGTYSMSIQLERATTPDEGAWEIIGGPWTTANATVSFVHRTNQRNEHIRLRVTVDTSGTATYSVSDGDLVLHEFTDHFGNVKATRTQAGVTEHGTLTVDGDVTVSGDLTVTGATTSSLVDVTGSTLTLAAATHGGKVTTLNRAAGIAVTVPLATGSGVKFDVIIGTTITSNTTTFTTSGSDVYTGIALTTADGGNTVVGFETAGTDDTITLNGSTTGGLVGDRIELIDVASGLWYARVTSSATGAEATPFSAA